MNSDFENQLQRQPMREIPQHWRGQILAATQPPPRRWRDLFWPAPQAWATLAAAWAVILALHFTTPDQPHLSGEARTWTPQSIATLQQQQLLMARLLNPVDNNERPPALPAAPKPQSSRQRRQAIV